MSAELVCSYAALILQDDGAEISAENIQVRKIWRPLFFFFFFFFFRRNRKPNTKTSPLSPHVALPTPSPHLQRLVDASGNQVEKYWPILFSKYLADQDVGALVSTVSTAGASAGGAAAGGAGGAGGDAAEAAAEEEAKKSESESDDDMGFSLFG